jgi:putative ABC transport system permease protein
VVRVILRELVQAARRLSGSPVFVLVAVVSLALGMGVTSTAFSLLSAVLFRPLPFPDADRLVDVYELNPTEPCAGCGAGTSWASYVELRDQVTSLDRLSAYRGQDFVWDGSVASERVRGAAISGGFLGLMGGRVTLGRDFSSADDAPGSPRVVLLGERFWRERLGGTPQVLGATLRLDGVDHTVIGVLAADFAFTSEKDVWVPLGPLASGEARDARDVAAYGHLAKGRDLAGASVELGSLGKRFEAEDPAQVGWTVRAKTLRDSLVADYEVSFWAFLGAVALVLLAAAANLSGLFLVRAADRQRETNVRAALGASRGALVRSLLSEGVVVALLGWAVGLLVALWGIDLALNLVEGALAPWIQVRLDWRVVLFSGSALGVATLLFGLLPAWKGSRHEVMSALRSGGGAGSALGHGRLRRAMVGAQVALAIVLATGAGLFLHRIKGVSAVDPGYDVASLLSAEIEAGAGQNVEQRTAAIDRALETVRALGGVESAAASNFYMLDFPGVGVEAEGVADDAARLAMRAAKLITPGYFATLGIPLARGRDLGAADAGGEPAASSTRRSRAGSGPVRTRLESACAWEARMSRGRWSLASPATSGPDRPPRTWSRSSTSLMRATEARTHPASQRLCTSARRAIRRGSSAESQMRWAGSDETSSFCACRRSTLVSRTCSFPQSS